LGEESYPITAGVEFETESVREWIRGEDVHLQAAERPGDLFADPGTIMLDALQWMPTDRRKQVTRRGLDHEEEDPS
jgi:hypothetical protein